MVLCEKETDKKKETVWRYNNEENRDIRRKTVIVNYSLGNYRGRGKKEEEEEERGRREEE